MPSDGITAFELDISYVWGVPRSAAYGGLSIDVDRDVSITVARNGDQIKAKQFVINKGMLGSAMEHSIIEQLFSTETDHAHGVSAVKIISIANNSGIPIYTIDKNNISQIMPLLQVSQEVKTDIQNAVNLGKVVTVPKTDVNYQGWQGVGYIVMNPNTGAAAYMISGGMAGGLGIVTGLLLALLTKYGIALIVAGFLGGIGIWPIVLGAILLGAAIGLLLSQVLSDEAKAELRRIAMYVIRVGILPMLASMGAVVTWWIAVFVLYALIVLTLIDIYSYYPSKRKKIYAFSLDKFCRNMVKT